MKTEALNEEDFLLPETLHYVAVGDAAKIEKCVIKTRNV